MSDITRVITLGIGPAATIDAFVLTGLNINPSYTGIIATTIKRTVAGLDMDKRAPAETPVIKRGVAGKVDR